MARNLGLILFVRSNVPPACKTIETNNNMFGYCLNPWNRTRSCGGSSGGESGLVSAFCSPIGLGTDIGGSLRIPADFTGLVTLKCTNNRISVKGKSFYGKFSEAAYVKVVLGPLTRNIEDLIIFFDFFFNR